MISVKEQADIINHYLNGGKVLVRFKADPDKEGYFSVSGEHIFNFEFYQYKIIKNIKTYCFIGEYIPKNELLFYVYEDEAIAIKRMEDFKKAERYRIVKPVHVVKWEI